MASLSGHARGTQRLACRPVTEGPRIGYGASMASLKSSVIPGAELSSSGLCRCHIDAVWAFGRYGRRCSRVAIWS